MIELTGWLFTDDGIRALLFASKHELWLKLTRHRKEIIILKDMY